MTIVNRGAFKPVYDAHYKLISLTPIDFDMQDRELFLSYIQHIDSHMVGSSNYTTDYEENYNLIFRINSGKGEDKSYKASEDYFLVLQVKIYTWCRPKDHIRKEILEGLEFFPIISIEEVLDAFEQRNYYRNSEKITIQ